MSTKRKKKLTPAQKKWRRIWRYVRPAAVLVLGVVIAYAVVRGTVDYVVSNYIQPVDADDATPIEVVIPSSSSASSIARILYNAGGQDEPGLISNTAVFKVYVDFVGKANTMKAGTYVLSRNMSIKQIVDVICAGNPPKATVTFTVPEGYDIRDIAGVLMRNGLLDDAETLYAEARRGEDFKNFAFISALQADAGAASRDFILEGYLFPDTYEVYADASVETIFIRMLNRFNEIFTDEYIARAAELDMSIDEVVTLASLIEHEAQVDADFAKVSAVFHNRLEQDMALQSCASLSYVLGVNKYTFTESELATDSPYNTYMYKGLPTGPICNPGKAALEAALWPNEDFRAEGYLFFCNGNPAESRELMFSKTYEEHQENVRRYQQYWTEG
ncbi:MAG: endolytic transglycosylase MltG [Clostridia bacterium]|nr:endolytic transglycosylase MltG [Clostridia bacterium]